ncbi:MAG: TldD/PmbA family protein [SAR202 cluster bacterium]|nr:TldD/PmbA family protein [SAR202 cluster bacterium]
MAEHVGIEVIERVRPAIARIAKGYAKRLAGLLHCDIRVEASEGVGVYAENGAPKSTQEERGLSFGVRVLAESGGAVAPGYFGRTLGTADVHRMSAIVREGVKHAHERARASAARKAATRGRFGRLADNLYDTRLAPVRAHVDTVPAIFEIDPRSLSLGAIAAEVGKISKAVAGFSATVRYNGIGASSVLIRNLYCSSEGANIDHTFAQSEAFVFVMANGETGPMELYDFSGHQRGWEVLQRGYDHASIQLPSLRDFALDLTKVTVETADAPPLPSSEGPVPVVTDPHYNTLLVHEIVGHPVELDRALKMEAGYAGRSWLLNDLGESQVGKRIASPLVNAVSDASIEGFGYFPYDHEGTKARRVWHIRDGVLEEFLTSRQTAAIAGVEANGGYVATDASMVPLVRMTNTFFVSGDTPPEELFKDIDHGYYVKGHRIPSISESRENFRISAKQVYEINHGEIGRLYRDGAVMSDSKDYFMRVDGVGNDFHLYPIPNCGKGQPMQAKRMSNGGPTMRSVARVVGP